MKCLNQYQYIPSSRFPLLTQIHRLYDGSSSQGLLLYEEWCLLECYAVWQLAAALSHS
jgi:hypothetical protein